MTRAIKAIDYEAEPTDPQLDLLRTAARAIKKHEKMKAEMRKHEEHLARCCQVYGSVYRIWGFRPEHLVQACKARGLLK